MVLGAQCSCQFVARGRIVVNNINEHEVLSISTSETTKTVTTGFTRPAFQKIKGFGEWVEQTVITLSCGGGEKTGSRLHIERQEVGNLDASLGCKLVGSDLE